MPRTLSTAARIARVPQFVKDGAPRKVRVYDNGGRSADRYTVVYSGNYGSYLYLGMNSAPFHPQGIGMHGEGKHGPIDRPTYGHLGKKIKYADLPPDCRRAVLEDYADIWRLDLATLKVACP
jgi:hypothetical protein